ncbi:MAG: Uma2 family endonuclease [Gemmataceae bacterium]
MSAAVTAKHTPEELLVMPDGDQFELVNGELVEKPMGWKSSRVGGHAFRLLGNFLEANPLGRAAPADASYQCFPDDPMKVRRPDASVVLFDRLPANLEPEGHCRVAPNLAVEVISPNDLYSEVKEKVDEYLLANVQLVWVIDPPSRSVEVYRADGTVSKIKADGELSGEDVLPGFRCPVAALFPSSPQPPVNGQPA